MSDDDVTISDDDVTMSAADRLAAETNADAGYLSRDELANYDDYHEVDVVVKEWGGKKLRVKGLSGEERDAFESSILVSDGKGNREVNTKRMRAKLVSMAVVFPPGHPRAGERMFDDSDIGWLSKKSAAGLDRVFSVAQAAAGLSDEDVDKLVEKMGKAVGDSTSS